MLITLKQQSAKQTGLIAKTRVFVRFVIPAKAGIRGKGNNGNESMVQGSAVFSS
jgi:hypothetical protein